MTNTNREALTMAIQTAQLITLVIGVGGIFMAIGKRDAAISTNTTEISELRDIATDLVRASVEATTTNREQDRRLDDLRNRLARLGSEN